MPELETRFHQQFKDQGLKVVALDSREPLNQIGQVQQYCENLRLTFPIGMEVPNMTYSAMVTNFPGPNPFPLSAIMAKDGTIRYISKEYDPDAQEAMIRQLLAE